MPSHRTRERQEKGELQQSFSKACNDLLKALYKHIEGQIPPDDLIGRVVFRACGRADAQPRLWNFREGWYLLLNRATRVVQLSGEDKEALYLAEKTFKAQEVNHRPIAVRFSAESREVILADLRMIYRARGGDS